MITHPLSGYERNYVIRSKDPIKSNVNDICLLDFVIHVYIYKKNNRF
jgi:hypothetical protein